MHTVLDIPSLLGTLLVLASVTLAKHQHSARAASSTASTTTSAAYWEPTAGTTWNIDLSTTWTSTKTNVSVLDLDLFSTSASTISSLAASGVHTICYFSAGSFEDWRPDVSNFSSSDYSQPLDGWPGEYWLNTSSPHVRTAMAWRLDLAKSKGCAGVDPDNTDGYDNEPTGFDLTVATATDYINWLAQQAHARGLAIGLKNSADVIPNVLGNMQWAVNEQCVQYDECDNWEAFIDAGKPVFGIEYPDGAPNVSTATKNQICGDSQRDGFSTLLKEMNLNEWSYVCPLDRSSGLATRSASATTSGTATTSTATSNSASVMASHRGILSLVAAFCMTAMSIICLSS
jgi:hypothetical protein